jgi:hypothetical protein
MTHGTDMTDQRLRQFLLRQITDEEQQQIEGLFLIDSETRERILSVEQDLIEDYLEGNLTASERERFLLHFAQTPAQQRNLRITKSIKDLAVKEAVAESNAPFPVSIWSRFASFRPKSVAIPVAIVSLIAIAIVGVWLNRKIQEREYLAIEQELARLNRRESLSSALPQMVSLTIAPVAVRSGGERQNELVMPSDAKFVELRLISLQEEQYSSYQAVIRRVGGDEPLTIRDLQLEGDGAKEIRVRLPAQVLARGLYRIELGGIVVNSIVDLPQEYVFNVVR